MVLAAGRWFFVHGGAGAVISSGAMRRASFDDVEGFLHTIETVSGGWQLPVSSLYTVAPTASPANLRVADCCALMTMSIAVPLCRQHALNGVLECARHRAH